MEIRKAKKEEIDEIVAIYKSLIGYEGCLWNEYYPARKDVENDINDDALYILKIRTMVLPERNKCACSDSRNRRQVK